MKFRNAVFISIVLTLSMLSLPSIAVEAQTEKPFEELLNELPARSQTDEFKRALEAEDPQALGDAFLIYLEGLGVEKDIQKAKYYAHKGYEKKDPRCTFYLATTQLREFFEKGYDPNYANTNKEFIFKNLHMLRDAYDWTQNDGGRMHISFLIAACYMEVFKARFCENAAFYRFYAVPWATNALKYLKLCRGQCSWLPKKMTVKDMWKFDILRNEPIRTVESLLKEYYANASFFIKKYGENDIIVIGYPGRIGVYLGEKCFINLHSGPDRINTEFIECVTDDFSEFPNVNEHPRAIFRGKIDLDAARTSGVFRLKEGRLYKFESSKSDFMEPPIAPPEGISIF